MLDVDALVDRPGSYWAYGELWAGSDEQRPIAFARRRLPHLERGRHPIRLLFGGAIIRKAQADGPYLVRRLLLSQVDQHPPRAVGPAIDVPGGASGRASDFQ